MITSVAVCHCLHCIHSTLPQNNQLWVDPNRLISIWKISQMGTPCSESRKLLSSNVYWFWRDKISIAIGEKTYNDDDESYHLSVSMVISVYQSNVRNDFGQYLCHQNEAIGSQSVNKLCNSFKLSRIFHSVIRHACDNFAYRIEIDFLKWNVCMS